MSPQLFDHNSQGLAWKIRPVPKKSGNYASYGPRNFVFWPFWSWENWVGRWISEILKNDKFLIFWGGGYFNFETQSPIKKKYFFLNYFMSTISYDKRKKDLKYTGRLKIKISSQKIWNLTYQLQTSFSQLPNGQNAKYWCLSDAEFSEFPKNVI